MVGASRFLLASLALLATPAAAADVWEVGAGGFATIQEAVDVAAEGDIVLVGSGIHPGFTVTAKSLTIVADIPGTPVQGNVLVTGLGAEQTVVIQGFWIKGDPIGIEANLDRGSVWIENCTVEGGDSYSAPGSAVEATSCGSIVIRRSTLTGGGTPSWTGHPPPGGHGVDIRSSNASIYACSILGGAGGWTDDQCVSHSGSAGGHGILVEDGTLVLVSSTAGGGMGGVGDYCSIPSGCGDGGDGGDGLRVDGKSSEVTLVDSRMHGGAAGYAGCWAAYDGDWGAPIQVLEGSAIELPGHPRLLDATSPVREGDWMSVVVSGAPQEVVYAYASFEADFTEVPGSYGFRLLGEHGKLLGSTTLSDAGAQVLHSLVPELGPSTQGVSLHAQVVAVTSTGPVLGEAATVVLLDSAF